ncbi:MAG: DUF3256 family protein, partial [Bacteroidia bacterium]|nr:DUF3256 family protein [Bacteroidia bacterium]
SDSLRVLAVVRTVVGPLKDSRVNFYDTSWKLLRNWTMPAFTINDFLDAAKAKELGLTDRMNEIGPRLLVAVTFKSGENAFVATSCLKEDLEKAQRETLGVLIRDSVIYRWKSDRFQADSH